MDVVGGGGKAEGSASISSDSSERIDVLALPVKGGVVAVTRFHNGAAWQPHEPISDAPYDHVTGAERPAGRPWAAVEERVAGEHHIEICTTPSLQSG